MFGGHPRLGKRSPLAFALVIGLAWGAAASAQEDGELESVDVAPGVAMWTGRGGNIGVSFGPDGVLLIDDKYPEHVPAVRAAVERLGVGPVRIVLNTHWHGDHTGGNAALAGAGAVIVAHHNVYARLSTDQVMPALGRTVKASPRAALPLVTFADGLSVRFNGNEIRVIHLPAAHTDGDAIVHLVEADVLHLGDIYFNGSYPFVDTGSGGGLEGMVAAVDRGLELAGPATRILPGHGPLSNRSELAVYRRMLATVRDRLVAARAAGKTADEVVASRPTADFDAKWAKGFLTPEQFVRLAYGSLR
ncbi:MAG: MBL fold metallo-hydrolase [Proteobacteria bacterium]|nr:MBL fold metallo-hydrolase [Pseudomonadota bacterium]